MQENALRNSAPSPTIALPEYSGHRGAWTHPQPSARALATRRLQAHRQPRKIGRWILLAALATAALLKGAPC
jgi:hypothetical protein